MKAKEVLNLLRIARQTLVRYVKNGTIRVIEFKCSVGVDISAYIGHKKERILDTINADVQGAYNGLRNVNPRFNVLDIMEGVVEHGLVPERLSVSDLMTKDYQQLRMSHRLTVGSINYVNN